MPLSKIIINNNKTHTRTLFIRSPVIATMNDTTFLAYDFFLQAYSVPRQCHHVKAHFHFGEKNKSDKDCSTPKDYSNLLNRYS